MMGIGDGIVPLIIAHRGFSAKNPENTLSAVVGAVDAGADLVEVDVQFTLDRHVIVLHDETVDRTTNGTGYVSDMKLEEVQRLDAGSWKAPEFTGEKIPTLSQILAHFVAKKVKAKLLIELKFIKYSRNGVMIPYDGLDSAVTQLIQQHSAWDYVVVQSFVASYLTKIQELDDRIPVAHLLLPWNSWWMRNNFYAYNPNYYLLSQGFVERAHDSGKKVMVWTVDKREQMLTCIAMNVDGIITNDPVQLNQLIKSIENIDLTEYAPNDTTHLWTIITIILLAMTLKFVRF